LSRVSDDLEDILGECVLQKRTDILAFYLGHYHNRVMCELSMFMHTAFAIGAGGLSLCERNAKHGNSAFGSPDLLRLLDWIATYSRIFRAAKEAVTSQERHDAEIKAEKLQLQQEAEGDDDTHTSALSAIAALPSRGRTDSAGSTPTKKKKAKLPEVELHLEHFIDLVARGYQAHVLAELAPIVLRIAKQSATVPRAAGFEYLTDSATRRICTEGVGSLFLFLYASASAVGTIELEAVDAAALGALARALHVHQRALASHLAALDARTARRASGMSTEREAEIALGEIPPDDDYADDAGGSGGEEARIPGVCSFLCVLAFAFFLYKLLSLFLHSSPSATKKLASLQRRRRSARRRTAGVERRGSPARTSPRSASTRLRCATTLRLRTMRSSN
jgi:hypothetical protein